MKSVKPGVSAEIASEVISREMSHAPSDLTETQDGQIATTYSFELKGQRYFIQFNAENMSAWHHIETLFYDAFRESNIPSRRIVSKGRRDGVHYCISEELSGTPHSELPYQEFCDALPSVMHTLHRIAAIDISAFSGYGWLDHSGNGKSTTWKSHIEYVIEEEPGDFYDRWHSMFDTTFLERDTFNRYYQQMTDLLPFIPENRRLVHGGYGYTNILISDGRVSGVLDWQDARYGDPLLDLAHMIFWHDDPTRQACIAAHEDTSGEIRAAHFNERLRCYTYYLGLDAMRFAAKTENESMYKLVLSILDTPWINLGD